MYYYCARIQKEIYLFIFCCGWSDKGATKIARIILKRFANAREM